MPTTPSRPRSRARALALPLVVAVLAAVALVVTLTRGDGGDDTAAAPHDRRDLVSRSAARGGADPYALGDTDAPVVMVNYSEFQCPFCGRFARETEPALVERYVEDGTLRIEWRDFPYLGPESTLAARGGRAAAEQDAFWEFHDAMYADQPAPNSGEIDEDHLADVAEEIGLDVDQFRDDLDDPELMAAIEADFREGQAGGITGTPAFVINGQLVMGAQPLEVFEQVIEQAAARG